MCVKGRRLRTHNTFILLAFYLSWNIAKYSKFANKHSYTKVPHPYSVPHPSPTTKHCCWEAFPNTESPTKNLPTLPIYLTNSTTRINSMELLVLLWQWKTYSHTDTIFLRHQWFTGWKSLHAWSKVLERHPTTCGRRQVGHGGSLRANTIFITLPPCSEI